MQRNEELEAEAQRFKKDFDETEYALAEATSKWMYLEQDRSHMANAARKINRHAVGSLKSGQLAGILVSSVSLALKDLPAVKKEAVSTGLSLGATNVSVHVPSLGTALERSGFNSRADVMSFLDYPTEQEEKGEIYWSEELVQMMCTEVDGLRRTLRENESVMKDKDREIFSLEATRMEITEMRNETEAARDAFYEHKETWEKSITGELTAQISALREHNATLEDELRQAKSAVAELELSRVENSKAIDRQRVSGQSREQELLKQLETLSVKHSIEVEHLQKQIGLSEAKMAESATLLDQHRNASRDSVGEHKEDLRHKQQLIYNLESNLYETKQKLEESETMASHARALTREKAELEIQMRQLRTEHETLGSHFKVKVTDIEGAQDREAEKDSALKTAAAKYMEQQGLLDELQLRAEELTKHAKEALLKLTIFQVEAEMSKNILNVCQDGSLEQKKDERGAVAEGQLYKDYEAYRAELEKNADLNPALAELMFARHVMNKLESQVGIVVNIHSLDIESAKIYMLWV